MAALELSEEFENGWLFLRENIITPYIRDPKHHITKPMTQTNNDFHRAYCVIKKMIENDCDYNQIHVEELLNRLLTLISEHLVAKTLPSVKRIRDGKKFLKTVFQTWEDHLVRILLLSRTVFPLLRHALYKHGNPLEYLTDCVRTCYIETVYKDIAGWIRKICFDRILDTAKMKTCSSTVTQTRSMIMEMSNGDKEFCSTEWDQPLILLAESFFDLTSDKDIRGPDFLDFLLFSGWLMFEGLSDYFMPVVSSPAPAVLVQRVAPKISKIFEQERRSIIQIVEEKGDVKLRDIKIWINRVPIAAEMICSIFKNQVSNAWMNIGTAYLEMLTIQQSECSCIREHQGFIVCKCVSPVLKELLSAFLDLWLKFKPVLKEFSKQPELQKQIKFEFRKVLDTASGKILTSEVLVDYAISLLDKMKSSNKRRKRYVSVFEIVDFLEDKESFFKNFQRKLANLLISSSSSSNSGYREGICSLTDILFTLEAIEIEQMVRDTEYLDTQNDKFADWIKGKQLGCQCSSEQNISLLARSFTEAWTNDKSFRVIPVRSASWPIETDVKIRLPQIVRMGSSLFERYYKPRHIRQLKWNNSLGRVIVKTSLFSRHGQEAIKLNLSMAQFCVLDLFQKRDERFVEDILDALVPSDCDVDTQSRSEKLIFATIRSLSCAKCPIFRLTAATTCLRKTDSLKVNLDFSSQEQVLVLPPPDQFVLEAQV